MISNTIVQYASLAQWALFLGIALTLFGWFEKKDKVLIAGQLLFLVLSLSAIWILFIENVSSPQAIDGKVTKEMALMNFFKGSILLGVLDLASLLIRIFKLRFQKLSYAVVILVALMLFFMVFNILQMPA
jgi:hypothetical protein